MTRREGNAYSSSLEAVRKMKTTSTPKKSVKEPVLSKVLVLKFTFPCSSVKIYLLLVLSNACFRSQCSYYLHTTCYKMSNEHSQPSAKSVMVRVMVSGDDDDEFCARRPMDLIGFMSLSDEVSETIVGEQLVQSRYAVA